MDSNREYEILFLSGGGEQSSHDSPEISEVEAHRYRYVNISFHSCSTSLAFTYAMGQLGEVENRLRDLPNREN